MPFISPYTGGAYKQRGLYLRVLKTVIDKALRKNLKRMIAELIKIRYTVTGF